MPRSPTVFNLVPGTVPQVPDTPISSAMFNAAMLDFEQTFNTPQPIQYGGTAATTAVGGFDGLNTKGANVATAATLNLDTATGAFVDLTGTTTVTAVTLSDGRHRMARATGAFQITVGASLIGNAGGSNINVEVGDLIIFEGYSAGVVRFWVIRASGLPVVPSPILAASQAQMVAASSNAVSVTPGVQHYHPAMPKIIVRIASLATSPAVTTLFSSAGTVTAVRNSTGNYTISWVTALSNSVVFHSVVNLAANGRFGTITSQTGTSVTIQVTTDSGSLTDPDSFLAIQVFGALP